MTSKRLYYILIGLVCLLVAGFLGGAYLASGILQSQAQVVLQARSKSASLEQQQIQLNRAKASINKYKDIGAIAKSVVPQDKDQAQAVREIVNIATANGVNLGTITFPTSTLGTATTGSTSSKPAATSTPAPAPNSQASKLSQLKAAAGISGVYTLQITVQSDTAKPTDYAKFIEFLDDLEHNRRTALVSGINVLPDTKNPSLVSFSLTIDEYIKP